MRLVKLNISSKPSIECAIAESFIPRFLGLMGRSAIGQFSGLIFPNCNSIHTFFMRFSIDVVCVGKEGAVLEVVEALKPWRLLLPRRGVKHMIEFQATQARAFGIEKGSFVSWEGI